MTPKILVWVHEPQANDFLPTSHVWLASGLHTVPQEISDSDKFQLFISIIHSSILKYLFSKAEANCHQLRMRIALCLWTTFPRGFYDPIVVISTLPRQCMMLQGWEELKQNDRHARNCVHSLGNTQGPWCTVASADMKACIKEELLTALEHAK